MMAQQLNFDFSQTINLFSDEKKTELISFRTGEKFKLDLTLIARAKKIDLAVLIHEYAIQGYLEDYKNLLLTQMNEKKTVKELLR